MSTTHCEFHSDGDDLIVSVDGEFDLAAGPHITDVTTVALDEAGDASRLVIDLTGATFIDSFGISMLLDVKKAAAERGLLMVLRDVGPKIRRPVEIVGLTGVFGL